MHRPELHPFAAPGKTELKCEASCIFPMNLRISPCWTSQLAAFAMFLEKQALKKEGPVQIITFIRLNIREKNHFDLTWDVANKTCQRLSKLFPWSRRFEHVASDFSAFLGSWQLPAPLGGRHAGCGMRTSAKSRVLKPPARWGPLTKSLSWP